MYFFIFKNPIQLNILNLLKYSDISYLFCEKDNLTIIYIRN